MAGHIQWRPALRIGDPGISVMVNETGDERRCRTIPAPDGPVQGGCSALTDCIRVSPGREQRLHKGRVGMAHCQVQRCPAIRIREIQPGIGLDQHPGSCSLPLPGRPVKGGGLSGRRWRLFKSVRMVPGLEQAAQFSGIAAPNRFMKRMRILG